MAAGTIKGTGYPDVPGGLPRSGYANSLALLKRSQLKGPLHSFLRRFAYADVVSTFDDFNRKAMDTTNLWTVANGGGAAAASFVTNTQMNGAIRGTTGTANDATASASLIGPIIYPGYASVGMEIRFTMVTLATGVKVEVGLIDGVPGSNTGGINNMDTPTTYMTNGALVGIDLGATNTKFTLVTNGNASNQAAKATASTVGLASVGVWQTVRIQVYSQELGTANATNVAAWLNGNLFAHHDVSATAGVGAVSGSVLLAPWVYINAQNASSKSIDVDYISLWAERI